MIGRLLRGLTAVLVYTCVATIIAQAILLVYLGRNWQLTRDRVIQILAIAQGIDLFAVQQQAERDREKLSAEQPSYEQILEARAVKARDLELREQALRSGLAQFQREQQLLADETKRCAQLRASLATELAALQSGAAATGTEDVRRTLESLKPKQAKELIALMLSKNKLDEVVGLLTAMPDSKRAKILGEFKTTEEVDQIGKVLERIRQVAPTAEIAGNARQKLPQPKPTGP